jgi:signal transduction histidine kinase
MAEEEPGILRVSNLEDPFDLLAPFRPAITGVRCATAAVGVLGAVSQVHTGQAVTTSWCAVIVVYALFRAARPLRYTASNVTLAEVLAEVAVPLVAVLFTGYWESPFVFSLITAVMVAGFARGFGFGVRVALAAIAVVGVPDLIRTDHGLELGGQWSMELLLVALVAGYARRISGEADRQQSLALDRLGRLADANALLYSLHRVAQSLPESLDLEEVLESAVHRLRDLFDPTATAILLHDETDQTWLVAHREGTRLPDKLRTDQLPPPVTAAVRATTVIRQRNLLASGGPGLAPSMASGLYMALTARGSVIGLIAVEHASPDRYQSRDADLLAGFVPSAALAIDNARWFARLRTVGAEEERNRIARDLHDRIGQSLAYLAFELDRMVKTDERGEPVGPALDRLRTDVREVIREVRDTLYDLRTDVSEKRDLPTVLELYTRRVQDRTGVAITVKSEASGRLPIMQERELFRIAQEALNNVEKHAEATRVSIGWWCDGKAAQLQVSDDGKGFVGDVARIDSFGIIGMRERADSIAATLEVQSKPGTGTTVFVRLDPTALVGRPAAQILRRVVS